MLLVRRLVLVVMLLAAQLAASAHGVEHALGEGKGLPSHVCELCLAAHDLGAGLPSLATLPLCPAQPVRAAAPLPAGRAALPAPLARQGAPPLA